MRQTSTRRKWLWAAVLWTVALMLLGPVPRVWAEDVADRFQAATRDFSKLREDSGSTGRRDLWQALDARLAALAKEAGKNPITAKILYYQAWTNAELGKRSHVDGDYETAAALYKRVADAYPQNSWADDALLRRASLLTDNLKRPAEARADLEKILRQYPKGDMAAQAKKQLATLGDAASDKNKSKADNKASPPPSSGPPAATSAKPATLSRVRVDQSPNRGQLTLTLDRETSFRYQILDQKRSAGEPVKRLYIDFDNTRTGPNVPSEKHYDKGLVSRLRAGYFTPDTVRVVLELDDVRQYEIRSETSPFRVILDLTGQTENATAKAPEYRGKAATRDVADAAKSQGRTDNRDRRNEDNAPGAVSKKGAAAATEAGRLALKPSADGKKHLGNLVEQLGLSVRTIMIDPGHGGKDPGAQGRNGMVEKNVNLQFAKLLGEALRQKGFNVLFTRTTDVFIPLETRTEMANTKGADLFVSIHCNAHSDADSAGLETYSLNLAKSQDAVRVAARENASSQKKISDLQAILTDLMLSAKTTESKDLAKLVQKRSVNNLRGRYNIRDRGPHEAPFFVLIGANMPAILVELGYITNPEEAKHLGSDAYMRLLAQGMAEGIVSYKARLERYANL